MTLVQFFILLLLALFFAGGWVIFNYLIHTDFDNPDGFARVTGECGDTMEIGFMLDDGKITKTHHQSNGCSISAQCIESTARLLHDKTVDEVKTINFSHIIKEMGSLPESHEHCALLAETTLQKALENYQKRLGRSKKEIRREALYRNS